MHDWQITIRGRGKHRGNRAVDVEQIAHHAVAALNDAGHAVAEARVDAGSLPVVRLPLGPAQDGDQPGLVTVSKYSYLPGDNARLDDNADLIGQDVAGDSAQATDKMPTE